MLRQIENDECGGNTVLVSSFGGHKDTGLMIAHLLFEKEANIIVQDICFSSCSEFLLAGASYIKFKDAPLIGFHGNPPMKEWLANTMDVPNLEFCNFEDSDRMYDLYFERGLNFSFWRQQIEVLELVAFAVDPHIPSGTCPKMGFQFKHEMWFPSSETLRNGLGLEFEGAVCADDIERCANRVKELFPNRGTFVIDDQVIDTDFSH